MDVKCTMICEEAKHSQNDDLEAGTAKEPKEETIPLRYRNGQGGVDIERVRRDQIQARRQVVRAMIRYFKNLRRRD